MDILKLIAELQAKKATDLKFNEAAILVRYNSLKKSGISEEQLVDQLSQEITQSKEFRKNSVSNTSGAAGGASEFVPETVLIGDLIDLSDQTEDYSFLTAFTGTHRTLASQSTTVPILGRAGKAIVKTEQGSDQKFRQAKDGLQTVNSKKVEIKAQKLYNNIQITDELSNFSVIELEALMLSRVRDGIMMSQADVIINADDTVGAGNNINLATDIEDAPDFETNPLYNFGKGLRKIGLSGSEGVTKINIGTPSGADDIIDLQSLITSSVNPAKKIIIMDILTYYAFLKNEDFKDAARNGKKSTIYTGAETNIAGSDLFVTGLIPLTDIDGTVSGTPADNVCGTIIVCDVTVIQHGSFGTILTNSEKDFAISELLEAYGYWGMNNINDKFAELNFVAVGYNVTLNAVAEESL